MISYMSLQFYINAALEVVAIFFLISMLFSCAFRKTKNNTRSDFSLVLIDLILLLLCNMTTWIFCGMRVSPNYYPKLYTLSMVLGVFDFFFYCFAGVVFFNYVCSVTRCVKTKRKKNILIYGLIAWCFITTGIFTLTIKTGCFYYFSEDGYIYYTYEYWVLVLFSVPEFWLSFYFIMKNRKVLKKKTIPLLIYIVIPMLLSIIDQLFNLSISYVCLAFIAFSIYIGVDIEQDRELITQEAENTEMKLQLMVSQIQPHFLYNTLSTIAYLCRHNPTEAENAVNEFSDYLSGNLRYINTKSPIPFETEIGHIENYLKIQKRRFSQRMNVVYDIQVKEFCIPALTIQPIVENAVKHCVEKSLEATTINISTGETSDSYIVAVKDNGPGFDTSKKPNNDRPHIGIEIVKSRLENLFGGSLEIESELGVGTTVKVIIPKKIKEKVYEGFSS